MKAGLLALLLLGTLRGVAYLFCTLCFEKHVGRQEIEPGVTPGSLLFFFACL